MKWFSVIPGLLFFLIITVRLNAQTNTYILNGSSAQNTCNCYTLTGEQQNQSGSVWNANKIDLKNSFDFIFNVFLGCNDIGADGIAFILQPLSTSMGASGEGMGFEGVIPSIGIALDTYQNPNRNDPAFDHISIQANGNINHGSDLAGPVAISATSNNVEDCQWHTLRITWDPASLEIEAYFDGVKRLEVIVDLVNTIFKDGSMVYWGFSGATGGAFNLQQFCTALNPNFTTGYPSNEVCPGQTIQFTDSSESFAPVTDYYWDFGNGAISTLKTPPSQVYHSPGQYPVMLALTAMDGCRDTVTGVLKVGALPTAIFSVTDTCFMKDPKLILAPEDNSFSYSWKLDGNNISNSHTPAIGALPVGDHTLELIVNSLYGCGMQSVFTSDFRIKALPVISIEANDGCTGEEIPITGLSDQNIVAWHWRLDGQVVSRSRMFDTSFPAKGNYLLQLSAIDEQGCIAEMAEKNIFINEVNANAGEDMTVLKNTAFQLNGTGGTNYLWTPSTGLSDPMSGSTAALLQQDITYTLQVTSNEGCTDTDDIYIKVIDKSEIYIPTAFTPNNDGLNDLLRPAYIGITQVEFFAVYNCWGKMVFSTREQGKGWDGSIDGKQAATDSYVWIVKGTDILGNIIEKKGSVVLIR